MLNIQFIHVCFCDRLQQEAQEREMDERIFASAKEKKMRDVQIEQEEQLAKVCYTDKMKALVITQTHTHACMHAHTHTHTHTYTHTHTQYTLGTLCLHSACTMIVLIYYDCLTL